MLDAGLVATVNSDDPSYFGGYLNTNFAEISDSLELSTDDVITLVKNSFTASFLPENEIKKHLVEIERVADRLA
jgi:adenosine deaminase